MTLFIPDPFSCHVTNLWLISGHESPSQKIKNHLAIHPRKINMEHYSLEVWFRSFSFLFMGDLYMYVPSVISSRGFRVRSFRVSNLNDFQPSSRWLPVGFCSASGKKENAWHATEWESGRFPNVNHVGLRLWWLWGVYYTFGITWACINAPEKWWQTFQFKKIKQHMIDMMFT